MDHCCKLECKQEAQFRIEWGTSPDNFTDSCEEHLGSLIGHRTDEPAPSFYRVSVIPAENSQPPNG